MAPLGANFLKFQIVILSRNLKIVSSYFKKIQGPPRPHRSSLLRIRWISRFKLDVFFLLAVAALQIFILNCHRLCCSCINTLFFYNRNLCEIIFSPVAHDPELPRPLHHFYKILQNQIHRFQICKNMLHLFEIIECCTYITIQVVKINEYETVALLWTNIWKSSFGLEKSATYWTYIWLMPKHPSKLIVSFKCSSHREKASRCSTWGCKQHFQLWNPEFVTPTH